MFLGQVVFSTPGFLSVKYSLGCWGFLFIHWSDHRILLIAVSSEPIPNDKRSPAEEVVSDNLRRRVIPSRRQKSVLVTGAAGFIGFHLASALAGGHHDVIGIDNFNDYYDVRLKHVSLINEFNI